MFVSLEAVVTGGKGGGAPVRRSSREAGRCEGLFWRRIDSQEAGRIRLAARKYELATKVPGARAGALGGVALEILDYLTRLVNARTGRLDPSLDHLMRTLKRSRDAIVRALAALRRHGFLDWLRRYVPTGNEGRGPQVQQTSNAYRLLLPERARRLLGRWGTTPPLPDDFTHRRALQAQEIEAHERSLSMEELPLFTVDDPALAAALSRLGRGLMLRESAQRTESTLGSFSKEI